ncbi:MAG: UDP-N-acetylglucosamine 1-carboxyvinyltransferase, partial [Clostridia bacterium]|nr:UDP-N-acetylglucosamine 1-carboxyvinyltransferase [Clostridia bacterium]
MEKFLINGGKPLCGEVHISGAKNAAVAILPAAILVDGKCTIENVPDISDVDSILSMISSLG